MKRILSFILGMLWVAYCYPQQAELERAQTFIAYKKYVDAAKVLRPLAEGGNAEAQYMVAGLFYEGKGVINSWEQAEKYYLLAAYSGHNAAAVDIFNIYAEKNQLEKGAKLLRELCEKNPERKASPIGVLLGYSIYKGLGGLKENKLLGWELMYGAKIHDYKKLLEELKHDFYIYLIDYGMENPMNLCKYMGDWKSKSNPVWTISYFDDMILKIKSLPIEKQAMHFKEWLKHSNDTDYIETAGIVLAMMYSEGIGTSQDMAMADACYSRVSNETNNLLANKGGFKPEDIPNFFQMVVANIEKRREIAEFEARKANIQVTCNVPQTIAKLGARPAHWENGTLEVTFIVKNKAMNPSALSVEEGSGRYRTIEGKSGYGKVRYVGGDYIGGRNVLKKGDMAFVTIEIKNMPSNGELERVSVNLGCQYGKGTVTVSNVVWDVKYQK